MEEARGLAKKENGDWSGEDCWGKHVLRRARGGGGQLHERRKQVEGLEVLYRAPQ
jgi:hypothetical protein